MMTDVDEEACLDLNISEGPKKVLETLQGINRNESFSQVCLSRNFPSPMRALTTETLVSEVLENIVSLPNSPHLKISYASATFPIHLLTQALASKDCATTILDLQGVKLAYKQTVAAIRHVQENIDKFRLEVISLENCRPEIPPNARIRKQQKGQPLDMFLEALSRMPLLRSMSLRLIEKDFLRNDLPNFPYLKKLHLERLHVSKSSLANICSFPNLQELRLIFIVDPPQNCVLQTLANVLAEENNHSTLQTLQLKFLFHNLHCLDEAAHNAFWHMLARNASLRELDLTMNWRMNPYESVFGLPIADCLQHNSTLQKLSLGTRIDDNDASRTNLQQSLSLMADALRSNQGLQQFSFTLSGGLRGFSEDQVYKVLLGPFNDPALLADQYWLECLTLWYRGIGQLQLTDQQQFCLDLNKAGRRKLLVGHAATRQDWIDALIGSQWDLSIVFFLLSRNPLLCQPVALADG